jgi:hypothetical protein
MFGCQVYSILGKVWQKNRCKNIGMSAAFYYKMNGNISQKSSIKILEC